ncbi:MAG: hypothetical protein QOI06_2087 [Nocardioidaceae bacterium]|jgi:hypothetical protein|nr:hypothetical protein [Nocardioidaceae bacterium]
MPCRTFSRTVRSLCVAALAAGLVLASSPADATGAGPAVHYAARGRLAAEWQASQLKHGHIPGFSPGSPDWGLTIDTAYMLAADGSRPAVLAKVKKAISRHILDYAVFGGSTSSGAMSKVLIASEVLRADPTRFGGINVRKRLLKLVAPRSAGFEHGRLRDSGSRDFSNVFGQSYGTIGLARSGGVPQSVVDYLVKQRCSRGYFRLLEAVGKTCNQSGSRPDVDATALALEALLAAKAHGATVSRRLISGTATWLLSVQNADGSFAEDARATGVDSNTTGLAGVALAATGHGAARLKAAHWVSTMQIKRARAGNGPARRDVGAIAFDHPALADAIANGLGDNRPQWWRSTPQAFFALVPIPLGTLTAP